MRTKEGNSEVRKTDEPVDLEVIEVLSPQEARTVHGGVQAVEHGKTPSVESEIGIINTIP